MRRQKFLLSAAALLLLPIFSQTQAQPRTNPIRFIVPYPPGGPTDQIARLVANDASGILGTPIVIENKAGAAGMIGAETVLRAEPNGSVFYIGTPAPLVINEAVYNSMPFNPAKDFVAVAALGKTPLLLVARKDLGVTTLPALVSMGIKEPGKIMMASASNGNITHLAGEYAASKLGFTVTHVPFPGSAAAITNMMGGNVDIMFDALPSSMQQAKSGKIVPIAIMDSQRFPQLPDVPTMAELGHKNLEVSAWIGLMARTGTPNAIIETMNKAINEALRNPELVKKLHNIGAQPLGGTPAYFEQFISEERKRWVPIAKSLKVKAD